MVDISCLTDNIPSGNFLYSYGIDGPFSANCDLPSYKTVIFRSANSTSWPEGNLQKSHLGSSWIGKCEIATRDLAHASTHFAPFWRMTIHDSPIRDHHKKSNVMFKDTVSPKKIEHLRLQNVHLFRISHAFLKHFGKKNTHCQFIALPGWGYSWTQVGPLKRRCCRWNGSYGPANMWSCPVMCLHAYTL